MIEHDERQIEKLKKLKEEYKVILSLSKEESVDFYTELIRLSERRMHEIDAILVLPPEPN